MSKSDDPVVAQNSVLVMASSRPLYEQLKLVIMSDIEREVYKHGQRLPAENELASHYKVSRITVRRAIAELVAEGFLKSQQGKGTFVNYLKNEYKYLAFNTISENATNPSQNMTNRIVAKEIASADAIIAGYLQIPEGAGLVRLKRVMYENGNPYMIDTAFFRLDLYPDIWDKLRENVSTFKILREQYKVQFARAEKALSVVRAGLEEATLLSCIPGDPLFSNSKIIYNENNVPVHYSHYMVHGDRCIYTLTVYGDDRDLQVHYKE